MRAAAWLWMLAVAPMCAQTVTTLVDHGDPANRIDLVFVSEGYTATEIGKFQSDVTAFVSGFFAGEAYKEYAPYFNVVSVAVPSNQSGASHPELSPPVTRDTAFGASYDCGGIVRLICVDVSKVLAVVNPLLPANRRDYVLVLVNDPTYGGSGGSILVTSTHTQALEIVLHESGHTVGLLADEYTDQPPACTLAFEPVAANATLVTDRDSIKWNAWIDPATPLPTLTTKAGVPGLYVGADYCPGGKYRPTYNSKMRALGNPFEPINSEQLVRRFYNVVSGIDGFTPGNSIVTAQQGTRADFSVTPLAPATHALTVSWWLDGAAQNAGASLSVETAGLAPGSHSVRVQVQDVTPLVRSDPANLLTDSQTWQLNVTVPAPDLNPVIGGVVGAGLSIPSVHQLSTGGLFSIFGSGFAPAGVSRALAGSDILNNALPLNLAQTCVQIGTAMAPLTFVSAGQINAQAGVLPESGTVDVAVIANCGTAHPIVSPAALIPVAAASPEFLYFAQNADGHNPVAAIQTVTGAFVTSSSPARPGDVITIFAVGFGATTPAVPPGTIAASAASTVQGATVTLGGMAVTPLYTGVTPTFAGLYQLNLTVPAGLPAGNQTITIQVNGGVSPTGAYLPVAQ